MKYYTIISIFVWLLTACNPDSNTNEKRTPSKGIISNQNADSDKRIKNKLLDDLINLIEKANADREKYVKKNGRRTFGSIWNVGCFWKYVLGRITAGIDI